MMTDQFVFEDITQTLNSRDVPTITLWNRLEGCPRTTDLTRALRAEARDALWMLTRQWQMGEFRGDDTGTPVMGRIHTSVMRIDKYRPNDHAVEKFEDNVPIEVKVESRAINFSSADRILSLDIRLLMGRQWLKLVGKIGDYKKEFIARYPIQPPDPGRVEDAHLCSHPEVWQSFAAAAGRLMDGASLYFYLKGDPARRAYDGIAVAPAHENEIDRQASRFMEWFEGLYYQPQQADAWDPSRLEYRFACSTPTAQGEKVYTADEYYQGRLDWYNFDIDKQSNGLGEIPGTMAPKVSEVTQSLIPTPIVYTGAPNTRWWTFEDRQANFGGITPDTTDLAKLLLIEFGLVYANDWFLITHKATEDSITRIEGLAVTNSFGERFWIEAAGSGSEENWQRWGMFSTSIKGQPNKKTDSGLLLLPTVPKIQEGRPIEEVILIRDEVANMVWAIEKIIPAPTGAGKPGSEAANETRDYYSRGTQADQANALMPIEDNTKIRYEVMGAAPENWIPFIPVRVESDNRQIKLQRAALPRILSSRSTGAGKPEKIRPRTTLLREGLDRNPASGYFIHEEEIPLAGLRVRQSFQRTRWRDGRVFVWLAVRKQTGRGGPGPGGLAFDRIVEVKV
ncbi:MAG TPA: hypothetical protein VJ810_21215 [Blastocatellia bacterium]|nr:hypothetical protein [Blastocatellia bacterium]